MPRSTQALPITLSAVLLAAAALAGAAPHRKPAPPARRGRHASPEPTAAQLPPVDPAWHQRGWHAVVPHAFVLRALAPARIRPEATAPAAFWLKGGVRVPILEQRPQWWRVGWTHGRSGWMPAAQLQPHASFILIDAQTGRALRRLAAKGEQGPVSDGHFLWSFSDTGITRTSLTDPPAIWSNPVHANQEASMPQESAWTPDHSAFFVRANSDGTGPVARISTATGTVKRIASAGRYLEAGSTDRSGRLLQADGSDLQLLDPESGRKIRASGTLLAVAPDGSIYASVKLHGGKSELIRYNSDLKRVRRLIQNTSPTSGCVSADGRVLAIAGEDASGIELLRTDTLANTVKLKPGVGGGGYPLALAAGSGGWFVLSGSDQEFDDSVTRYTHAGRPLRSWDADGRKTVISPDGKSVYIARDSDLLAIDTASGATRRIPYNWRPRLPNQYLPKPSDPDTPTHLVVSSLALTPDGHTLILTEWLNGDPEG